MTGSPESRLQHNLAQMENQWDEIRELARRAGALDEQRERARRAPPCNEPSIVATPTGTFQPSVHRKTRPRRTRRPS